MHKPRLRRLDWLYTPHPIYFLTACTYARRHLLSGGPTHQAFEEFFMRAAAYRVAVGRYVLMPDHIHLFAAFGPDSPSLSDWMKALKRSLANALKATGVGGPYWQKGFFDHVLRSQESYKQKWLYVRENPVRAGLVRSADLWPYQGEIFPLSLDD